MTGFRLGVAICWMLTPLTAPVPGATTTQPDASIRGYEDDPRILFLPIDSANQNLDVLDNSILTEEFFSALEDSCIVYLELSDGSLEAPIDAATVGRLLRMRTLREIDFRECAVSCSPDEIAAEVRRLETADATWAPLKIVTFGSVEWSAPVLTAMLSAINVGGEIEEVDLQWLPHFDDPAIVADVLKVIGQFTQLKVLTLPSPTLNDSALKELARCRLRELDLSGAFIDNDLADVLSGMTTLERLAVPGGRLNLGVPTQLGKSASIRELDLTSCGIQDEHCKSLAQIATLIRLSLAHNPVSDVGVEYLSVLKMLRSLNLSYTGVSDECVESLAQMPALSRLSLRECKIDGNTMAALVARQKLKSINLDDTDVDIEAIQEFAELETLEELSLNGCGIDDNAVPSLIRIAKLKQLSIARTDISARGMRTIRDAKPGVSIVAVGL